MEEIIAFDDHVFIPEKKCEGNGEVISAELIPTEELSEYGKNKDFVEAFIKQEPELLNEDTLNCNVSVIYKGKEYKTGNRRGHLVELYDNEIFFKTVHTRRIKLA